MPDSRGSAYTLAFAAAVCAVCGLLVSAFAVGLKSRQDENRQLDRQRNVLLAAGLISDGEPASAERIRQLFAARVRPQVIVLETGMPDSSAEAASFDQRRAAGDPRTSRPAPDNRAQVSRLPQQALVYQVLDGKRVDMLVLPVEGKGLWSTLYGYLALDGTDVRQVRGIAFYEHGETPGLGGEIENPKWRARWPGRRALDDGLRPILSVRKGPAGAPADDPYHVDGLSGATITSNGVTELVRFWLGEHGFAPYLTRHAKAGGGR